MENEVEKGQLSDAQVKEKGILIIDDDLAIRFVLKKIFSKYLAKQRVKIYTSSDGVSGLGYAFIINPELIIIDTTLPKYSGRELVDYLTTNDKYKDKNIIVLTDEDDTKYTNLPVNYAQISKKDKDFPLNLINLVLKKIGYEDDKGLNKSFSFRLLNFLSKKIIKHSNKSDVYAGRAGVGNNSFQKLSNYIGYLIQEVITSMYLTLFYLLIGKKDYEESIEQKKRDLSQLRVKIRPALAVGIASVAVVVIGFALISGSVLGITLLGKKVTHAATAYTWSGGGADGTCGGAVGDGNKWSCTLNWTPNGNPTATDTITFDGTSTKNVTVDSGFTGSVGSINIASGYTGTITLQRSLQTTSTFTISDGIFDAKDQILNIDGAFTMNAGSTLRASSDTMYFASTFTINGGTFDKDTNAGGTVIFDGTTATLSCNNVAFNMVALSHNSNTTKTVNANCAFPLGANPYVKSSLTLNGTISGSGELLTSYTLTLNAGASITGFTTFDLNWVVIAGATADFSGLSAFHTYNPVTLNSGTLTLPNGANLDGTLTISGGTFNAPSGTMTLAKDLTITGTPTFNANGGTVRFDGGTATLSCNNVTFNHVILDTDSHLVKTVNSNCTLPLGANPEAGQGDVVLNGQLTGSGTILFNAGNLTMNTGSSLSGFTGIITGQSLTIAGANADFSSYTGDFTIAVSLILTSGTLSLPPSTSGAKGIYPAGSPTASTGLTITGGTFNSSSGILAVGTVTISGTPTFNANGGTIRFISGNRTLSCNNVTFNKVEFYNTTGTKTINSNCSLPLGANPILSGTGNLTLNGTMTGTGTLTKTEGGTLTLNANSSLSGFSGLNIYGLTVAGATADFGGYNSFTTSGAVSISSGSLTLPTAGADLNGSLAITGGTFTAPSGTMTLAKDFVIIGSPTFNANGGTVEFDGTTAGTFQCNNVTFNKIKFSHSSNSKILLSGCNFPAGANPTWPITNGGTIMISSGVITGTGTLTMQPGGFLVLFTATGLSGFSGLDVNRMDLYGYLGSWSIDLSSYSPFKAGTFSVNSGTSATLPSGAEIGLLAINGGGTLDAPTGDITINGTGFFGGGVFNHHNGTVIFNGNSSTIYGSTTFNNLTLSPSNTSTITFTAGDTQTVNGTLTMKGSAGKILSLRSSTPGTQWKLAPQGNVNVEYVDVKDSNNIGSNVIQAGGLHLTDSGNNTGWNFNDPAVSNLGSDSLIDAGYINNNQPTFTFDLTDLDTNQTIQYRIQISKNSAFTDLVLDYTSTYGKHGGKSYLVGQDLKGSYTVGEAGMKLEDTSYSWRVKATDNAGGNSAWVKGGRDNAASFRVDTVKPTGSVSLVNNTDTTEEKKDILIFPKANDTFSGVQSMMVSEDSKFTGATWESYTTTKEYTFSTEGEKTIYIKFKDKAGNESEVYSKSIEVGELPGTGVDGVQSIAIKFLNEARSPIEGLSVTIGKLGFTVLTNAEGYAVFDNVPQGEYKVQGKYKGKSFEYSVSVKGEDNISVVILKDETNYLTYALGASVVVLLAVIVAGTTTYIIKKKKKTLKNY